MAVRRLHPGEKGLNRIDTLGGPQMLTVVSESGLWFAAKGVCDVLEKGNPRQVVSRLDDDERSAVHIMDVSRSGIEQNREVTAVNESGLYSLILTSRFRQPRRL